MVPSATSLRFVDQTETPCGGPCSPEGCRAQHCRVNEDPEPVPNPGTVYRDAKGRVLMFVRTERWSGMDRGEHLFVTTRKGTVFSLWTDDIPPDAELVLDVEGRRMAEDQKWLRLVAEHDIAILLGLLKRACGWLPAERAAELRAAYVASRP